MKKEAFEGGCWATLCHNVDHHRHGITVFITGHETCSPQVTPRLEGVTRPKCKDMIGGLMCRSKPRLPPNSKESPLEVSRKLYMKDQSIELGKCVDHHDCSIVVWIHARA